MRNEDLRIGNIYEYKQERNPDKWIEETCDSVTFPRVELEPERFRGIELNKDWMKRFGYAFYNGKTDGDMTLDFGGKLDIDFIDGKIKVKSHYETEIMYREIKHIKYVHQLQNLYFALTGEELKLN